MDLLDLYIENNGRAARHNISIRIPFVRRVVGSGLSSVPPRIVQSLRLPSAIFDQSQGVLEVPPIAELPVNTAIQLSVWGNFSAVFHDVQVRSSEGVARISEGVVVSGWPLFLALNFWWISILMFAGLGILLLWRFESQRTP